MPIQSLLNSTFYIMYSPTFIKGDSKTKQEIPIFYTTPSSDFWTNSRPLSDDVSMQVTVCNAGPTSKQHRANLSCLIGPRKVESDSIFLDRSSSCVYIWSQKMEVIPEQCQTPVSLPVSVKTDRCWTADSANIPANTGRRPNVGLMLAHRLRRWANIKPALVQRLVFVGMRRWSNVDISPQRQGRLYSRF